MEGMVSKLANVQFHIPQTNQPTNQRTEKQQNPNQQTKPLQKRLDSAQRSSLELYLLVGQGQQGLTLPFRDALEKADTCPPCSTRPGAKEPLLEEESGSEQEGELRGICFPSSRSVGPRPTA